MKRLARIVGTYLLASLAVMALERNVAAQIPPRDGITLFLHLWDFPNDYNMDFHVDVDDLTAFSRVVYISTGASVTGFGFLYDLNDDGTFSQEDINEFAGLFGTTPGDADLDRDVDISDLNTIATNWGLGAIVNGIRLGVATWSDGDFNGDRQVSAADLNLYALNAP